MEGSYCFYTAIKGWLDKNNSISQVPVISTSHHWGIPDGDPGPGLIYKDSDVDIRNTRSFRIGPYTAHTV